MLHAITYPDKIGKFREPRGGFGLGNYCGLIVSLILILSEVQAQSGAWTRKKDLPTARAGASASVVNGKIYVFGGYGVAWGDFNVNEMYDPLTNTWETKAPSPTARSWPSAAVVNDTVMSKSKPLLRWYPT